MNDGTRVSIGKQNVSTIMDFKIYNLLIKPEKVFSKNQRVVEYNEYNFFDLIKKARKDEANEGRLLAEAIIKRHTYFLNILQKIY